MAVTSAGGGEIFLSPTSMSGGNTVSDPHGHELGMALTGSESVNPLPDRLDNAGLPQVPAARTPLSTQAGNHGGVGLPAAQAESGGWTTGVQPGGRQGHGTGGGSSGADAWKPTESSS